MKIKSHIALVLICLGVFGCSSLAHSPNTNATTVESLVISPQKQESDEIYSLLAYAVVLKDWQVKAAKDGARGHNIGCVLVDPAGVLVHGALNCNGREKSGTHHGETRVMWSYQSSKSLYDLKGYSIYTTLEPCAMCSGMMIMQKVGRTVYGQTDLDFGKAIERLQLDSAIYAAYPRSKDLSASLASTRIREKIDETYRKRYEADKTSITEWLRSDEAKVLYQEANDLLKTYRIKFDGNKAVLESAKGFLAQFSP